MEVENQFRFNWLPSYNIRRSKKAKRAHIVVKSYYNVEVVLPVRLDFDVNAFLLNNKSWICKQLQEFPKDQVHFPEEIYLVAIGQKWEVSYQPLLTRCRLLERPDNSIAVIGHYDWLKVKKILNHWLKTKASIYLTNWVESLSIHFSLPFNRVKIKGQKTIWGSCTYDHIISLNYKLLFLPKRLVNYIIIHELCHTKILKHNNKYWQLVENLDPNYKQHRSELNGFSKIMPTWLE